MIRLLCLCALIVTHLLNPTHAVGGMLGKTAANLEHKGAVGYCSLFGPPAIEAAFGARAVRGSTHTPAVLYGGESVLARNGTTQPLQTTLDTSRQAAPHPLAKHVEPETSTALVTRNPFMDMKLFEDPEKLKEFISLFIPQVRGIDEHEHWGSVVNTRNQHFHLLRIQTPSGPEFLQIGFTLYDYWNFAWEIPLTRFPQYSITPSGGLPTRQINFIRSAALPAMIRTLKTPPFERTLHFALSDPGSPRLETVHQVRLDAISKLALSHMKNRPKAAWLRHAMEWDRSLPPTVGEGISPNDMTLIDAILDLCSERKDPIYTMGQYTGLSPQEIQRRLKQRQN